MVLDRLLLRWRAARRQARLLRAGRRELDALFLERSELLGMARLKPKHRHRATLLEVDEDARGGVTRVLFGIVRHPRSHPLATRGDEVLELIEYRPAESWLGNVGSRNLTRHGTR